MFTGAIRHILKINMALLSFAFSVTNGSQLGLHGTSTVNATLTIWRRFQFNVIPLSFAGPSLLRDNGSSVYLIRPSCPQDDPSILGEAMLERASTRTFLAARGEIQPISGAV